MELKLPPKITEEEVRSSLYRPSNMTTDAVQSVIDNLNEQRNKEVKRILLERLERGGQAYAGTISREVLKVLIEEIL